MTEPKIRFLQGNEACVEGAIDAGCRFFAGYPITPSTEIAEEMARRLPLIDGTFIQMEDEIASMAAIIGASLCGVKSLTATSGPGFSLKQEHIGYAVITETPCVIVNVQRGGPSTGLPTLPAQGDVMQSRWGTHGDHPAIVLAPGTVKECYELTVKAFNLSETFRTPVIILSDEVTAHTREKVIIPENQTIMDRARPDPSAPKEHYMPYKVSRDDEVPVIPAFGQGYRFNITGLIHDETGFPSISPDVTGALIKRIHKKIESGHDLIKGIEIDIPSGCDTAILSYGSTSRSARRAAREANIGNIKLTTLFPFPDKEIRQAAEQLKRIVVVEMNLGQIRLEVERAVCGCVKVEGINIASGKFISPWDILDALQLR